MHVFSNKSQMSSKCDKNGKVTHNAQPSVSLYESFKFKKPMPCPHGRANTRIKSINLSDIFSLFMYLRLILSNSANTRKREWYRTSLWAFFFCVYYCNTSVHMLLLEVCLLTFKKSHSDPWQNTAYGVLRSRHWEVLSLLFAKSAWIL